MPHSTLLEPTENEIILDMSKVIMSKTNYKGIIEYVNNYFMEVSGYSEEELIGKPHNIIRHPDMPKAIFKLMWKRLHKGESIFAAVKNLTKDGSYYWVLTKFETTYDKNGNILAHYARRKALPIEIRTVFEALYKNILAIEKHDIKLAEESFYEVIEDNGLTYDDLILEIVDMTKEELNDYFQSKDINTNISNENTIIEMDNNLKKNSEISKDNITTSEMDKKLMSEYENSDDEIPIFEMDNNSIEDIENLEDVKNNVTINDNLIDEIKNSKNNDVNSNENIKELEKQIAKIQNRVKPNSKSNGFLGNIFDEIKKENQDFFNPKKD